MNRAELLKTAKPILFNTEMVKAILDGRKTVTRRAIKPQPVCYDTNITIPKHDNDFFLSAEKHWLRCRECGHDPEYSREGSNVCHHWIPPYQPGDILYVRETWFYENHMHDLTAGEPDLPSGRYSHRYVFKADSPDYPMSICDRWYPSIHMPKEAARLFLRVTDVRVERLQSIDYEGCKAEGIWDDYKTLSQEYHDNLARMAYPKTFAEIWNSTVKPANLDKYGWDANPWVWVIEFERVEDKDE